MRLINIGTEETPVVTKTKELCQTILDQPSFQEMKKSVTEFLSDATVRGQYERLCELQETLHHKSHEGTEITEAEMAEFEQLEQQFMANPTASGFIGAQQAMNKMEQTIGKYVRRTLELGRVPEDSDFEREGGCCGGGGGGGCGCH